MIGVFDSGRGGITAVRRLRELAPALDICYYADRKNLPYGTKSEGTLIRLVSEDIKTMLSAGAERVLIACCTASTVYDKLPQEYRAVAHPIIAPASRRAVELCHNGRIAVLCTEATKRSCAFEREIRKFSDKITVRTYALGELVDMVERGVTDRKISETQLAELKKLLYPAREFAPSAVILGCTHFTHLKGCVESAVSAKTVSASHEGACEILKRIKVSGSGKIKMLSRVDYKL